MEGLLAVTLWDIVIDVFEPLASRARGDPSVPIEIPNFPHDTGNH